MGHAESEALKVEVRWDEYRHKQVIHGRKTAAILATPCGLDGGQFAGVESRFGSDSAFGVGSRKEDILPSRPASQAKQTEYKKQGTNGPPLGN